MRIRRPRAVGWLGLVSREKDDAQGGAEQTGGGQCKSGVKNSRTQVTRRAGELGDLQLAHGWGENGGGARAGLADGLLSHYTSTVYSIVEPRVPWKLRCVPYGGPARLRRRGRGSSSLRAPGRWIPYAAGVWWRRAYEMSPIPFEE